MNHIETVGGSRHTTASYRRSSAAFLIANVLTIASRAEYFPAAFAVFRMNAADFPAALRTALQGLTGTPFHAARHRFKPLRFAPGNNFEA